MTSPDNTDKTYQKKYAAATRALDYVDNNMKIGLGTGSTANIFIDLIAHKIHSENLNIECVATSKISAKRAFDKGIKLIPNSNCASLDIAVDGTDEFDPQFRLIKGGGGALLREKIIAQATHKFIIIADDSKYVDYLGNFSLPVECINYETKMLFKQLTTIFNRHADSTALEFIPEFRKISCENNKSSIFLTDLGHYIVDINFKKISDPESLAYDLHSVAGIVEHGLFLKETNIVLTNSHVLDRKG